MAPHRVRAVSVAVLVVLLSTDASADGFEFLPPLVLPAGPEPGLFAAEDVNADGFLDLLVHSTVDGRLRTLINDGRQGFLPPVPSPIGSQALHWDFGNLDGDGLGDAAIGFGGASPALKTLLGDGAGHFVALDEIPLGSAPPADVAIADVNGDGHADVLVLQPTTLRLFAGDGAGGLAEIAPAFAAAGGLAELHAVHVDEDGHTDVILLQAGQGFDWTVLQGHGDGTFSEAPGPSEGSCLGPTWTSAAGDINGDNLADFITSYNDTCTPGLSTTVMVGTSDGVSVTGEYPEDVVQLPFSTKFAVIADVTGDGFGDLVASLASGGTLGVLVAVSDGETLKNSGPTIFAGYAPQRVAAGDFDNDARVDVAFTNLWNDAVVVMFNATTPLPGWTNAGGGLAGSHGKPALAGGGHVSGGSPVQLSLQAALPLAPATLVIGFQKLNVPFKGGLLMPSADVVVPGLVVSPGGGVQLAGLWPSGLPVGFTAWMQAWIKDPAGPKGYAASNGVAAKVLGP
jgi:hypothetical protein